MNPEAIAVAVEAASPALIALSLGVPFAFMAYVLMTRGRRALRDRRLRAVGSRADAVVLSVRQTGAKINHRLEVRFDLEVRPDDAPRFRARATTTVALLEIPRIQPGCVVRVSYVPHRPGSVAIVAV